MSRSEDFDNAFWSDPDVAALSPAAKLVYVWSWTNPRCGMAGLYKVVPAHVCMETGLNEARLQDVIAELTAARFLFFTDQVMLVRARVKRLRTRTVQMAVSIAKDVAKVPVEHPLRAAFVDANRDVAWLRVRLGESTSLEAEALLDALEPRLTRGSGEPHDNAGHDREVPTLTRASPEALGQGQGQGKGGAGGTKARRRPTPPAPDQLPDDLPENLRPAAEQVVTVLTRVAAAKGAKPVTLAAVGRALASHPDHDHVRVAGDVEHWWVHGTGAPKPMVDVVATYRNRLDAVPAGRVHHLPHAVPANETPIERAARENAAIARANGDAA